MRSLIRLGLGELQEQNASGGVEGEHRERGRAFTGEGWECLGGGRGQKESFPDRRKLTLRDVAGLSGTRREWETATPRWSVRRLTKNTVRSSR